MRKPVFILVIVLLLVSLVSPVKAGTQIRVFFAGTQGSTSTALALMKDFVLVSDPAQADVLVLDGEIPAGAAESYRAGAGLVLILEPALKTPDVSGLLGIPLDLTLQDLPISLVAAKGSQVEQVGGVLWNSAPQVRERYKVSTPISAVIPQVSSFEDGDWVLWSVPRGDQGEAYIFNAFLDGANPQIQEWAYFNYLIYTLVVRAAGQPPLSFAAYPASPVPHERERVILIALMTGLLTLTGFIFYMVRRYSQAHPEALNVLISGKEAYESRQASTEWEEVGFHRPLGGFLLAFMLGLVLFIPLIIYQSLILPVYILPSAQALGIWGRVTQFLTCCGLSLIWVLDWHSLSFLPSTGSTIRAGR